MQAWLYQMSRSGEQDWSPEKYRLEVREGKRISWPIGKVHARGLKEIAPGDLIVLFYAKTDNDYPGIYGWGLILNYNKRQNRIAFRVTPPSDYLKTDPLWNTRVEKWVDRIRGRMRQRTVWGISSDEFAVLRDRVRQLARSGAV